MTLTQTMSPETLLKETHRYGEEDRVYKNLQYMCALFGMYMYICVSRGKSKAELSDCVVWRKRGSQPEERVL